MRARLVASIAIALVSLCLSGASLAMAAPLGQTPVIMQVRVIENANLREGPGTSYDRVGGAKTGEILDVIGTSDAGDWYQLASGYWIAASLVEQVASTDSSQEQLDALSAADENTGIPDAYNPEKALNVTHFVDPAKAETLRLGRGKITDITISPKNDYFAVATPVGIWVYSLGSLDNGYLIPKTADSVSVSWSPDGNFIAIAQKDGAVSIVDAAKYELLGSYFVDDGSPVDVEWSANGQYVASATDYNTIHVWDTSAGDEVALLEVPTRGSLVIKWLPESVKLAASGITGGIHIWDIPTQTELDATAFEELGEVTGLALSPDGHNMAVATADKGISIMDVSSETVLNTFRSSHTTVVAVGWLNDGVALISVDLGGHIDSWDTNAGTFDRLDQTVTDGVGFAAFSSDRKQLVTCTYDGRIIIWRLGDNEPLAVITGHADLNLIDWLPDGRNLLLQSYDTLEVVDIKTGQVIRAYDPPENYRRGLGVSADGAYVAVSRVEDQIAIVDLTTMSVEQTLEMPGMDLWDIAWSTDGQYLLGADAKGSAYIWDLTSGELVKRLDEINSMVGTVAWSPDGLYFASGSNEEGVTVWDAQTWEMLFSIEMEGAPINMEWSSDGTRLLVQSWSGNTSVLDVDSETMIPFAEGTKPLTWSPDGQALYVEETDGTISELCVDSWRNVASFYTESIGTRFDMKWSPLGNGYVIAASDGTLRLFDGRYVDCNVPDAPDSTNSEPNT